ncbi:MAG: hypothetical protein K8R45_03110 [Desulfobacterales bacterium]|nr:hypothetical protein [Desulfobacterales bacterium]
MSDKFILIIGISLLIIFIIIICLNIISNRFVKHRKTTEIITPIVVITIFYILAIYPSKLEIGSKLLGVKMSRQSKVGGLAIGGSKPFHSGINADINKKDSNNEGIKVVTKNKFEINNPLGKELKTYLEATSIRSISEIKIDKESGTSIEVIRETDSNKSTSGLYEIILRVSIPSKQMAIITTAKDVNILSFKQDYPLKAN